MCLWVCDFFTHGMHCWCRMVASSNIWPGNIPIQTQSHILFYEFQQSVQWSGLDCKLNKIRCHWSSSSNLNLTKTTLSHTHKLHVQPTLHVTCAPQNWAQIQIFNWDAVIQCLTTSYFGIEFDLDLTEIRIYLWTWSQWSQNQCLSIAIVELSACQVSSEWNITGY
jgi:hypothetical protein